MMIKKMIAMLMLIGGCTMSYAAASNDLEGTQVIAPHLGAATRIKWDIGERQPFWVHGKNEFNSVAHQQLLFIADTKSGYLSQELERLETAFKKLPKRHTDADVEAILKNAADSVDNALFALINGKRMVVSYKGLASKALLILREGAPAKITENACAEPTITRLAQMSAYKGLVFMRGMSRTDEQINETIQTVLAQEGKTPRDVAQALVSAEGGESVAAAFFDYDLFKPDEAVVSEHASVATNAPAKQGKKKSNCSVQ